MWKEYAVQAECLVQSWEGFRAIFHQFGYDHGRWLAKYPAKDWLRFVYQALESSGLSEISKARIVESLNRGRDALVAAGRPYNTSVNWLENAVTQQSSLRPFNGIIAMDNPTGHASVRKYEEVAGDDAIFTSPHQIFVPRTAADLSACLGSLLGRSKEILLIDPYFGRLDKKFLNVMEAMLTFAVRDKDHATRLEYHLARAHLVLDEAAFSKELVRRAERHIPSGLKVSFMLWEQKPSGEKLHDRYVLTEHGGVDFSVGLDEGNPGETTKVTRLSSAVYTKLWHDHKLGTETYSLFKKYEVVGRH